MSNKIAVLKTKAHVDKMNTGLDAKYRASMSKALTSILSDTYRMTIKSQLYHWNVVGPLFKPLHELTEEHYNALFKATDIVAERIRALGHLAPIELADAANFAPRSSSVRNGTSEEMIEDLITDHESAARAIREAATRADEKGDVVTTDMLTDRLAFHEKALWMLRAHIS